MSVLSCDRVNCENVMCDILVENTYICNDCAEEFRRLVEGRQLTRQQMYNEFIDFIESEKRSFPKDDRFIDVEDFLQNKDNSYD